MTKAGEIGDYERAASQSSTTRCGSDCFLNEGVFVRKSKNKSKRESGEKKNSRQLVAKAEAASQKRPRISSPDVALTLKHFNRRIEKSRNLGEGKRLYLRVGDEVNHLRYEEWGIGVVTEVMTSSIPGGTCLARVRFQDGQLRCFNNDLDNDACCYYFGVRRYWNSTHGVDAIHSNIFLRR